jgi:2-oxoglutarate dehydrogenase E2 component (dihydrolipoamide succinyltransferase)
MSVELKIPNVGESITNVEIGEWLKSEGDHVERNENLVVIETEKATLEIPSPISGTISKIIKHQGEIASIGEVIGDLVEEKNKDAFHKEKKEEKEKVPQETIHQEPSFQEIKKQEQGEDEFVPRRRIFQKESGGHKKRKARRKETPKQVVGLSKGTETAHEKLIPMSPLRRHLAQRLVQAKQEAALLTTFNEIDMTEVFELRQNLGEIFKEKFGLKLGLMSFFVKAVIEALKEFPVINAEVRDNQIVYHTNFHIGIAVSSEKGLVVPVLRNADCMSFGEIEKAIADFVTRAGESRLELKELQKGTFTISNGGVFGSLLSTPIVNPPQSAILGMHAIQSRPVALDGAVALRSMMYVALTYDHRIIDGREAVGFLKRIKEFIQTPSRMLLEV